MLVAPKYNGLELPLFAPETPVLQGKLAMMEAAKGSQQGSFVRAVVVRSPRKLPKPEIMDFLELADQELNLIAQLCGSQAVEHWWGQYKVEDSENDRYKRYFLGSEELGLPSNHILVAEVEVVKGALPIAINTPLHQKLSSGAATYIRQSRPYHLADYYRDGPGQFVVDPSRLTEAEPTPATTQLVDIDPIFY